MSLVIQTDHQAHVSPVWFDLTGDQFPGAADQTHTQLPAHLQDAVTLWLVGCVCVAAHPVPAAPSPRAQIFLGLQRSDSLDAADSHQIPA